MSDASTQKNQLDQLIKLASYASVCVAVTLLLLKIFAWFSTGSVGVLASLVDSLLDLLASLLNMFAIRYAMTPADNEHRFGHGKAESLAGLGQALFISGSALFLIVFSIERLVNPTELHAIDIGSIVIGASIAITFVLVAFQRYVANKTGSLAIKADSLHYASDLFSNAGVLVGLVLYQQGIINADPIIALIIGIYILKSAYDIGDEAIHHLLDHELSQEEQDRIIEIAKKPPEIIDVHDLRTRQSGRTKIVQLHLVMDGLTSLMQAHAIADEVEDALKNEFIDIDVLIHLDPDSEIQE
ncbi:MAG: cation diffusion facilitator family transporter [Oleiphilaceae bacterium]|nr:cation diffusion facilitator family transporter [Oleiphilaceae bacterium]